MARIRIALREPMCVAGLGALAFLALFGFGAAWLIGGALDEVPLSRGWFCAFVSLPLGVLVGGWATIGLMQLFLHWVWPSRLDGDREFLRVRVWRTWDGLFSGFRRSNGHLPRQHLLGISFGVAQGDDSQLFISHDSGFDCYAGFTGERQRCERFGNALLGWLARDEPVKLDETYAAD